MNCRQREKETLKDYAARFNAAAIDLVGTQEQFKVTAFQCGLRKGTFLHGKISRDPPRSMEALWRLVDKEIQVEETGRLQDQNKLPDDRRFQDRGDRHARNQGSKVFRQDYDRRHQNDRSEPKFFKQPFSSKFQAYTPLNTSRTEILARVEHKLPKAPQMKKPPTQRNKNKYCRYHKDHGHETEECRHLKDAIEELIQKGALKHYAQKREARKSPEQKGKEVAYVREIMTISGGSAAGGETKRGKKAYAREVNNVNSGAKKLKLSSEPIIFGDEDFGDIIFPHDDAMDITLPIANALMHRVLIDSGSSADILYYQAYEKLNLSPDRLKPVHFPLYGFAGDAVVVEGTVELEVTMGKSPEQRTIKCEFVVVRRPSAYNAIIGRPTLNKLQAIVSTAHLKMKFPTPFGIGEMKGNQGMSRRCYLTQMEKAEGESLEKDSINTVEVIDNRDESRIQRGEPVEKLERVELVEGNVDKVTFIGSNLRGQEKDKLIDFLRSRASTFAFSARDMPGIDPSVIKHSLNVKPDAKPVKQKKRNIGEAKSKIANEETEKLYDVDFIE